MNCKNQSHQVKIALIVMQAILFWAAGAERHRFLELHIRKLLIFLYLAAYRTLKHTTNYLKHPGRQLNPIFCVKDF